MNTQNVNIKTAAQESSRKIGGGQSIESALRKRVAQEINLREGVEITVADVNRYGDVQVEIRTHGLLNWRAWSFEPDFLTDLESNIRNVQKK